MPTTILQSVHDLPPLPSPSTSLFQFFLPPNLSRPSDPAFIAAESGAQYTRREFRTNALRLGAGLKKRVPAPSSGKGKRIVLVFSPNSIHYPLIFFACQASLTIASLANASYTAKELCHQLRDGKPSVLFVHPALWPTAKEALRLLAAEPAEKGWVGKIQVFYTVPKKELSTGDTSIGSFEDLYVPASDVGGWEGDSLPEGTWDTETAVLCYSSGTVRLSLLFHFEYRTHC